MFDLNKKIGEWKTSLSLSDSISEKDSTELENHLTDEIENLKEKGLSDKEAFWVARNRIGDSDVLNAEFSKSNIKEIYINRFSWILYGGMIFQFVLLLGNVAYNSAYILMITNGFNSVDSYSAGIISFYVIFLLPIVIGYLFFRYSKPGSILLGIILEKKSWTGLSSALIIIALSIGVSFVLSYLGNILQDVSTVHYSNNAKSGLMEYTKYMIVLNNAVLITVLFLALKYMNYKESKMKEVRV